MRTIAVAILAAGESRRMGQPKALVQIEGLTFVEHLLAATRHPRIGITRVVLGAGFEAVQRQLNVPPEWLVNNENWREGQLSSIQAAIRSLAPDEAEGILICPVDHPLISGHLVARLVAEFDLRKKQIVLPTHEGRRGHPVIFHSGLFEELLAASPEVGARQVVWAHPEQVAEVPTDEIGITLNLNDPETLGKIPGR